MTINREQALQLITDRLCGELGAREAAELQAYIEEHPGFHEDVQELEAAWQALGLLAGEGKEGPAMSPELCRALGGGGRSDQLSDEDLDLAAGGLSRYPVSEDEPPDGP
jgi:hypothetical protein